jgi:tRNA pseudouridine55 synthase
MHAALKQDGTPLYRLARAGKTVERRARPVTLRRLALRECRRDFIEFDVECSKGTYVRVLGEEIAARLGTVGHLSALRRLWIEPFVDAPMITLDELGSWSRERGPPWPPDWWRTADEALSGYPRVDLDRLAARDLRHGKVVRLGAVAGTARAYDPCGQFLGLVEIDAAGMTRVKRFFVGAPPPEPTGQA